MARSCSENNRYEPVIRTEHACLGKESCSHCLAGAAHRSKATTLEELLLRNKSVTIHHWLEGLTRQDSEQDGCVPILTRLEGEPTDQYCSQGHPDSSPAWQASCEVDHHSQKELFCGDR
jgi:hypothetical protein